MVNKGVIYLKTEGNEMLVKSVPGISFSTQDVMFTKELLDEFKDNPRTILGGAKLTILK